jgi:hypothetical protein
MKAKISSMLNLYLFFQSRDLTTMSILHGLLQYLGTELQDSEDSMAGQDEKATWASDWKGLVSKVS